MKTIAVTNRKGGVGKTTTAINIATAMAAIGKKVVLVDLDPQGNATTSLGLNKNKIEFSIYDVLLGNADVAHVLKPTLVPLFDIVPAKPDLAAAEVELIGAPNREKILKAALMRLESKTDYVLIDCPPSLNLLTINALCAANSVIVPLQCEFLALEGLADLMKNIERVKRSFNPTLKIDGIVLTMFDRRNNLSFMVEKDVRKFFGDLVYQTVIPRNVRVSEAPSHGKPIMIYDFKSVGAQSYISLAKEVLQKQGEI
ncbi:MAG: ParA family protein [Alphaproteobacteria bacterium]|nr:ParA family protein [Alphaproteobacteria bacterium]